MKRYRLACQLSAVCSMLMTAAEAQQPAVEDYTGTLRLGLAYTDEDNYSFGQYNGLYQGKPSLIGKLQWQDFSSADSYWKVSGSDLGLNIREGEITWGKVDRVRLTLGFDSQHQQRNNDGRTPFTGRSRQLLPANWSSGLTTGEWGALEEALQTFDRQLKRDQLFLKFDTRLNRHWQFESGLSYELKRGDTDVGGAIYLNGASGDAVLLRQPIDYRNSRFDLGLVYSADRLQLQGRLNYSSFDNEDDQLSWQNPYSSFGAAVRYPQGEGGLGLAPDNNQASGRLWGQYIYSARARLQFDSSYAVVSQNQDYLPYTVNPTLAVTVPLPRNDFDGAVATSTFNSRLVMQPLAKMHAEVFYKYRDRNYDAHRDGYLYVRGDGADQPPADQTVYNSTHDLRNWSVGFELGYRLPLRGKLSIGYTYEDITRKNAAAEQTGEDRYTIAYRLQPWSGFTAKIALGYADRAADTYEWGQSYYALLDTDLINATADNQRYINHPRLYQFYLANREQWQAQADFNYLPTAKWNLNLNLQWRDEDYDQSELGLTGATSHRVHLGASYMATANFSASVYAGYDDYRTDQASRAYRGGQEKNAFAIYPPLPQASDPRQNWAIRGDDSSVSLGTSLQWQIAADLQLSLDYNYSDTRAEQHFSTAAGSNLVATNLPPVNTRLHQLEASGIWKLRENLSLRLDYQHYRYRSDDWAWNGVGAATIDKVLTFGQDNPNEHINYVGASVIYSWQ